MGELPVIGKSAEEIILEVKQNGSTSINLSNLGLVSFPVQVLELIDLEVLILSSNRLDEFPLDVMQLPALKSLELSNNNITKLPPEIGKLVAIQELHLRSNELIALPSEIGQLTTLKDFNVDGNELEDIPAEIGKLIALENLSLRGNNLKCLPSELGNLKVLRKLNLKGNNLEFLPPELGKLVNLNLLNAEGNALTDLPPEIGRLKSLHRLDLNFCKLHTLPAEIGELKQLRELHLYQNNLNHLPKEIGRLSSLQELAVLSNKLVEIPSEIGEIGDLRILWARDNALTSLPTELGKLSKLKKLDVSQNQLTMIPSEIGELNELDVFNISKNSLPESFVAASAEGTDSLLTLLRALKDPSKVNWVCEAKLLITGEGKVGKTCLRKALDGSSEPSNNEATTWGVECGQFEIENPDNDDLPITLNYWDFGGQKIYRVTQQFFYSDQGVYLLVWDPRRGEEQCMLQDWLTRISVRTAGHAKVILVATHALENGETYAWKLDLAKMERKHRDIIVDQICVDSIENHNINDLKTLVAKHVKDLPSFNSPINRAWQKVRDIALSMENPSPWMTYNQLEQICLEQGIADPDAIRSIAATYIHRLGRGVWYGVDWPKDPYLRDTIVRKPSWLSMAFMVLIEHEPTRASGGILSHDKLEDIWKNHGREKDGWIAYNIDDFARLLRMLQEQGVAIPTRGSNGTRSLVPQLVPGARPKIPWDTSSESLENNSVLRMRTKLDPEVEGIFPSLVAALEPYHFYDSETGRGAFWTNGLFLRDEGGRYANDALLEIRRERTCIWLDISVMGEQPGFLLHQIDATIARVIEFWPGVERIDEVFCPTLIDGVLCEGHFKFKNVKRWLRDGTNGRCQECDLTIQPEELLMGLKGRLMEESIFSGQDDLSYLRNRQERPAPKSVIVSPVKSQWKDIKSWQVMRRTRFKARLYSELSGQLISEVDFTGDPGLLKYISPIAKLGALFFGAPLPFELPTGVEDMLDEMSDTLDRMGDFSPNDIQKDAQQPNLYLMREFLNLIGLDPEAHGMDLAKATNSMWYWMSREELFQHKPQPAVLPEYPTK